MTALVGRQLDRFEIVSLLGAGGMGSVYRARDPQLKRDVAIKVLPEGSEDDPGRLERFHREIRTVARLSHTNIVKIHDFGRADGVSYAVMELLRGKNLRARMHGKPLAVAHAVEVAIAVANGLGAAHREGILHRDVKPENIFLTSAGEVKVLDFGLARDVRAASPEAETESMNPSLTIPGTIVGTTGYMSPEQIRAKTLDARSDIFSLGCVMYEMLAGSNPFRRDTRADTMSAILEHHPPPLTELRPTLPPALDLIVARCLEKNPDDRFESARDVAFALQALSGSGPVQPDPPARPWWRRMTAAVLASGAVVALAAIGGWRLLGPPPPLPEPIHLAVMRLEAAGDTEEERLLAAGLTEKLAADLTLVEEETDGSIWVLPAVRAAERDPAQLASVATKYAVTAALVGSLDNRPDRFRLQLRLVEPATGRTLRRSSIEDGPANLDALQIEPLLDATGMLGHEVSPRMRQLVAGATTNVAVALKGYLLGLGRLSEAAEGTGGGAADPLANAVTTLEAAVRADPTFVPARLASARAAALELERTADPSWLERGLGEAAEAARLGAAPGDAEAARAALYAAAGRLDEAREALEAAVQRRPESASLHENLGRLYQRLGRIDDAEAMLKRAIYLRDGYWVTHHWLAMLHLGAGDFEAAALEFKEVKECAPGFPAGYNNLGLVYHRLGRIDAAREVFEESLRVEPDDNYTALVNLGTVYFETGRFDDAAGMFERALELDATNHVAWGNLAFSRASSGRGPDRAVDAFNRAIELAEEQRRRTPGDADLLCTLATYYAAVDRPDEASAAVEEAIATNPTDPQLIGDIAGALEDLGQRDRALEWVERAFAAGIPPSRFENRPTLRELVADERYRSLVSAHQ